MIAPIPKATNDLSRRVLDCVFRVHTELGPGLLESIYQAALAFELAESGIYFEKQPELPVFYKGQDLQLDLRPDFIIDRQIVLELKAVESLHPVFEAQLLTYLRLTGCRLGFLLNFHVLSMKNGIRRMVL